MISTQIVINKKILNYFISKLNLNKKKNLECYSGLEEQACQENNIADSNDQIYWQRICQTIQTVCQTESDGNILIGVNASYCLNPITEEYIPIRHVISRILASEEYFKYVKLKKLIFFYKQFSFKVKMFLESVMHHGLIGVV